MDELDKVMVRIYARKVKDGHKSIEDVPERIRAQVRANLDDK
ncbi:CD1375 family protein [Turicimonas muris]|nr:CD1375 family protein [Turicimonas muris]